MLDFCIEIPEPGTRVRVRYLYRHWVEGVIIAVEKVDGVTRALVEVDPAALNDWEVMADPGGPITPLRPLRFVVSPRGHAPHHRCPARPGHRRDRVQSGANGRSVTPAASSSERTSRAMATASGVSP